jgi:hypothetical protein
VYPPQRQTAERSREAANHFGNSQTQIYFRVSRQDAERLAKESTNIVRQLEERDSGLLQEPVNRFSLQEMWEVAFHSLARLEQRNAYIMVKGAMEHPELIRTQENPVAPKRAFPFDETYSSMDELTAAMKAMKEVMLQRIDKFLQNARSEKRKTGKSAAKETGLGFVDTE